LPEEISLPAAREAVVLSELVVRYSTEECFHRLRQQHLMKAAADTPDCHMQWWQHSKNVCGSGDGSGGASRLQRLSWWELAGCRSL
jgi:hypothetical protein